MINTKLLAPGQIRVDRVVRGDTVLYYEGYACVGVDSFLGLFKRNLFVRAVSGVARGGGLALNNFTTLAGAEYGAHEAYVRYVAEQVPTRTERVR